MDAVLRRCAELLDMSPDVVKRHGSLMFQEVKISIVVLGGSWAMLWFAVLLENCFSG